MNIRAKAGASSAHSKRCRAVSTSRRFAKRLECDQLAGAFGSWSRCAMAFLISHDSGLHQVAVLASVPASGGKQETILRTNERAH